MWIAIMLKYLLVFGLGIGLAHANCQAALGMQSGQVPDSAITASSSYDDSIVGPKSSRIRTAHMGGAWCPKSDNKKGSDTYEYLQIDLGKLHKVTMVEIQGRFGNGQGQEFADFFMLDFQRDGSEKWNRFRDDNGKEDITGNTNTYAVEQRHLSPPIIARKIRFIPFRKYPWPACIRVEIFGCEWTDGAGSISSRCYITMLKEGHIVNDNDTVVAVAGQLNQVICNAVCSGNKPPPALKWYKGNLLVSRTLGRVYQVKKAIRNVLTVRSMTEFDIGEYRCKGLGISEKSVRLVANACPNSGRICDIIKCIDKNRICDGNKDCWDGTDEKYCSKCHSNQIECDSGKCFPDSFKCDGVSDCADGSDEFECDCGSNYTCGVSGACVAHSKVCDGVIDCLLGEYESKCVDEKSFCNSTIHGDKFTNKFISNSVLGTNCFYTIKAKEGKVVQLTLKQIDFGSRTCTEESVVIYVDQPTRGKQVMVICSDTTPRMFSFRAPVFFIEYRNPLMNEQEDAFRIEYEFVDDNFPTSTPLPTTKSPVGGDIDCSGRFIDLPEGYLTYTSPYEEDNKHCIIVVRNTLLDKHVVHAKFEYFDVEESENCTYDSLRICSGESAESRPMGGPYCGNSLTGRTFVSSGNSLRIEYVTDRYMAGKGFKALITFEPYGVHCKFSDIIVETYNFNNKCRAECSCDEKHVCFQQGYEKLCIAGQSCDIICENDGKCVKQANSQTCYCKDGFLGDDCSIREVDGEQTLRFSTAPMDNIVLQGFSVYPKCQLDVDDPSKVQYRWTFEGRLIGDYHENTGIGSHVGGVLQIDSFNEELEGQYSCIAATSTGVAEHTFQLRMVSNCIAQISRGPGLATKDVGRSVLLICEIKGAVKNVTWHKDGRPIDWSDGRFQMLPNYYLLIKPLEMKDSGAYSCHLVDQSNCRSEKSGTLTVLANQNCGISTWDEYSMPNRRISGGTEVRVNEDPWHVMFRQKLGRKQTFCGGTLISKTFVLTAAHCITDFKQFDSRTVALIFGTTDCLEGGTERTVKSYILHPEYNKTTLHNDIAIIELDSAIKYGMNIRPICLRPQTFIDETLTEPVSSGRVVGCGKITEDGTNLLPKLNFVNVPYVSQEACKGSLEGKHVTFTDTMFCAGSKEKGHGDACEGDSGGGIYNNELPRVLVGIMSFGFGCDIDDVYGIYTNVGRFHDWISQIIAEKDCTCDDNRICIQQGYEQLCLTGQRCNDANCHNRGTCVREGENEKCYCKTGFVGDDCSDKVDGTKVLRFLKAPRDRNIQEDKSINPDCQLDVSHDIEVQYKWTFDGEPIGPYSKKTGFGTHPGGLLAIDRFSEKYEGQYSCIAKTAMGTAEHSFNYRMVLKCEFEVYTGTGTATKNVGQTLLLPCYVRPSRRVEHVTWKKNGIDIDFSDSRFEMKTNNYLEISGIEMADKGNFSCHVEDIHGCSSFKTSTLTVTDYQWLHNYCGVSIWDEVKIQSRISKGSAARDNEFPWHANFRTKGTASRTFCGGTLISQKYVVTSGHCVKEFHKKQLGDFGSKTVTIHFGTTNCTHGGIQRTVGKYFVHHDYNKDTNYNNDIAIIELDSPVEYGVGVRPICLAEKGFIDDTFLEKHNERSLKPSSGRVAGCGKRSQYGRLHKGLQVVHLPYVPFGQCDEVYSELNVPLTDSRFCAGSEVAGTGDFCRGDSGGGFVMPTDDRWILTGVSSFGAGCDILGYYGVYTHVGLFYDWIKEITKFDEEQVENFLIERA